jgi:hypothetical protein
MAIISKKQFCYESFLSLDRKGGECSYLREDSKDPLRSSIYLEILRGNTYTNSFIDGRVIGIAPAKDDSPFTTGCFEEGCFNSQGIWTLESNVGSPYQPTGTFQEGCVSDGCIGDFNPLCKVRLPFTAQGESVYEDDIGKYTIRDLTPSDCIPIDPIPYVGITTEPFITGYKVNGTRLYSTYRIDNLIISIEESSYSELGCTDDCFDKTYFLYAELDIEDPCFDQCSMDCTTLIGIYNSEGSLISQLPNSLYNDPNQINDLFLSGNGIAPSLISLPSNNYQFLLSDPNLSLSQIQGYASLAIDIHIYLTQIGGSPVQALLGTYVALPSSIGSCDYLCSETKLTGPDNRVTRYRSNGNNSEIWLNGVTSNDHVYVVDIGYLHPLTYEPIIEQSNIPIRSDLSFSSTIPISEGVKIVILKRVNSQVSTTILHHMTGYQYTNGLTRTYTKPLLNYNNEDQSVDLENLSISLINILLSKYTITDDCFGTYEGIYLDPKLLALVESNLSTLSLLIDRNSLARSGSIPAIINTYSSAQDIYNDRLYLDREISPFEPDLFSEECFSTWTNDTLCSRKIDNRAIAWYLYLLAIYKLVTSSTKYDIDIKEVSEYLIRQVDSKSNLVYKGWNHSDIYTQSIIDKEYQTSTSIMVCLSLMKVHDITLNSKYIDVATDLYTSIYDYLYSSNEKLFFQSYDDPTPSLESSIYGLLFANETIRSEAIEVIIKDLKTKTKSINGSQVDRIITNSTGVSVRSITGGRYRSNKDQSLSSSIYKSSYSIIPIHDLKVPSSIEKALTTLNLLEASLYLSRDRDYVLDFEPVLDVNRGNIDKEQITNRMINSAVNLSTCLSEGFSNKELFPSHSYYDVETLLFNRTSTYKKLISLIPKNYTWPSERAISPNGNIGRILMSFSKSLSTWWVLNRRTKDGISLSLSSDSLTNRWANDFSLTRKIGETDSSIKERIRTLIADKPSSSNDFITLLNNQGISAKIKEVPIYGYSSFMENNVDSDSSSAYYSGQTYANTSSIIIETIGSAFNADIAKIIEDAKPIATNVLIEEHIQIESCDKDLDSGDTYINISSGIITSQYTSICCVTKYDPFRPYPLLVNLDAIYEGPIYVQAFLVGDVIEVTLLETPPSNNLIGIIRSGLAEKMFIIPTHFF